MGGGSSKANVTHNITNNILNTADIDSINKSVVNSAVNVLVNNASKCSSAVNQNNLCSFDNATVAGDFTLDTIQDNKANINFSCIQTNKVQSEMASNMMQTVMGELNSLSGTDAAAKINAASDAANKSGFASSGGSASSSVDTNIKNNITNQTRINIQNLYEKNLNNNFTSNTVNDCIGMTKQTNKMSAAGASIGGKVDTECIQTNSLEQVQKCKQLADAANSALEQTMQDLGFKVIKADSVKTSTDASGSAKSEQVSTGPIQEVGKAVSDAITAVGNVIPGMASLASLAALSPFLLACCAVVCVCLISLSSSLLMSAGSSSSQIQTPTMQMSYSRNMRGGSNNKNTLNDYNNMNVIDAVVGTGINLLSDILISDSSSL